MRDETLVPGVELLESMRSVGYSFDAAVADIVDNSIAAHAQNIQIVVDPVMGSYVAFRDDGTGMSPKEAREALKLAGTRHAQREATDLGRFGLGLKTASLSQGRRLTVVTIKGGEITALQWDLDHVLASGDWAIRVLESPDLAAVPAIETIRDAAHGTLVVWEELDYLLAGAKDVATWMGMLITSLRDHLGLVFHRFLDGRESLNLSVNGIDVMPIDPFLERNGKTQVAPVENVIIEGHHVTVEAFTLPHVTGLSAKDRRRDDLGPRMRDYQGFYVYRNQRLINAGGWFGLAKQDELSKQTRVRVDIPPALDQHWQLDIKKSRVEPPQAFRQRFRQIIDQVKVPSARVHRFRGRTAATASDMTYFWRSVEDRDGFRYEINTDHPQLKAFDQSLNKNQLQSWGDLLVDLAASFPTTDLYVRMADNKPPMTRHASDDGIVQRLRAIRDAGAHHADPSVMSEALEKIEPFNDVSNLLDLVLAVWKEAE